MIEITIFDEKHSKASWTPAERGRRKGLPRRATKSDEFRGKPFPRLFRLAARAGRLVFPMDLPDPLSAAIERVMLLEYGVYDLPALREDAELEALWVLRTLQDRAGAGFTRDALAHVLPDLLFDAIGAVGPPLGDIATRLLGYDEWRSAGKIMRFGAARSYIQEKRIAGVPDKTVRPQVARAVAFEVARQEVDAQHELLRRTLAPKINERSREILDSVQAHLTHLHHDLPLLPSRARITRQARPAGESHDLAASLLDWSRESGSNLAVVLGPFGSGKTSSLARLAETLLASDDSRDRIPLLVHYRDITLHMHPTSHAPAPELISRLASEYFVSTLDERSPTDHLLARLDQVVIMIDGFDELIGTAQHPAPDLRLLGRLLTQESKVLVACRRRFALKADAFVGQLREPALYSDLGITSPLILEIQPNSLDDIKRIWQDRPDQMVSGILAYLEKFPEHEVAYLFRPLLLHMLMLIPGIDQTTTPITIAELYRRYVRVVLQRDFQQGNSAVPEYTKHAALREVAAELLTSTEEEDSARADGALQKASVEIHVVEAISRTPGLDITRNTDWMRDFAQSNHILVCQENTTDIGDGDDRFVFVHPTFFEFFAAEHFIRRLAQRESLGIGASPLERSQLFESLVPYFIKAALNEWLAQDAATIAGRKNVGDLDRLLCLYLLEDHPQLPTVLRAVPQGYREFLEHEEHKVSSFFLRKVIKYQLILMADDMDRAMAYVEIVREAEDDRQRDIEDRIFSTGSSPEAFLLERLNNRNLQAALPITIYRLGQFGGRAALSALLELRAKADDRVGSVLEESIELLIGRTKANN